MEALSKIDALCPDIVIMDINIPIMNGLKVIQLSRIKHPETAYVIVSGYDDFSYCREALRLQITDYILKPVNYDEFGSCIDNLKISLFERGVTHSDPTLEESLLRRYDGILVLKDGRVNKCGSFDELMRQNGYFHALFTVAQ